MFLLFFVIWIIFNGQLTLEIALFGVGISAVMYWFICKFFDYSIKREVINIKLFGYVIKYVVVLVWEIIKANIQVIKMIGTSRYELEPALLTFHIELKTESARVLLANSITLTPGTITVALDGDEYMVHCLDKSFGVGIDKSVFVEMLTKMEELASDYIKEEEEC